MVKQELNMARKRWILFKRTIEIMVQSTNNVIKIHIIYLMYTMQQIMKLYHKQLLP